MHRGYIIIIFLLLSSLACGFFGFTTQAPQATPSPVLRVTTTTKPGTTQTPIAQGTTAPTSETPTKTPYPTSALDTALTNEINLIQTQVVQERGLQPKGPVAVVLLSPDELRQNTINDYQSGYTCLLYTSPSPRDCS